MHCMRPLHCTGGTSPRFWYATPPPPPLPALRAHLVAKGQQLLAIHMVAPKAPEIFFFHSPCPFCPLCTPTLSLNPTLTLMPTPTLSLLLTLPTNLTLDPNPNPSPNPNPTLIKTEYWDRAGGGGNISYDW